MTGAEVRNNALKKVYLCQIYGCDTRLKGVLRRLRPGAVRPLENDPHASVGVMRKGAAI